MASANSFVVDENDLQAVRDDGDTATVRIAFDAGNGCERLVQRIIRFGPGRAAERPLDGKQEVLFVVHGRGRLHVDGRTHELEPDLGVYLVPGEIVDVENTDCRGVHALYLFAP